MRHSPGANFNAIEMKKKTRPFPSGLMRRLTVICMILASAVSLPFPSARNEARAQAGGGMETGEVVPVCDRTPQVRDALLSALDITDCMSVTEDDLGEIDFLDLRSEGIISLSAGDFSGMSSLEWLLLNNNSLTSLPESIFAGLGSLRFLWLRGNGLTGLPEGIFSGLSSLEDLVLNDNSLSVLPEGVFNGLNLLRSLNLGGNPWVRLSVDNVRVSEDEGTADVTIRVAEPPDRDLTLRVSTGDGAARAGEDYTALDTALTIPAGETSGTVSVSITADGVTEADETFRVTAEIEGTLVYSGGILIPASATGFVTISGPFVSVCDRTPQVRNALVRELRAADCADITEDDLNRITSLNLRFEGLDGLLPHDFKGLRSLRWLFLNDNNIGALPEGIFGGLSSLEFLQLDNNSLNALPETVFGGLAPLRNLCLNNNGLDALPEEVFRGLGSLRFLDLGNNDMESLPEGVFRGLGMLDELNLSNNKLATLPGGVFSGLSLLDSLSLRNNGLVSLPERVFGGLSSLDYLDLWDNQLSSLPKNLTRFRADLPLRRTFRISRNPWDFALLVDDTTVAESEGRLDVTVTITEPLDYDLTLEVATVDGTARADEDYERPDGTLTIAAGRISGTVSIPVIKDGTAEEDEVFELIIRDGPVIYPNAVRGQVSARATITISEFASVAVSPARITTSEDGGADGVFTVALDARPTADVTATVTIGDTSEGAVSPDGGLTFAESVTLTFTPETWGTPQTVTLKGLDDDVFDGDAEYTINLATLSDDVRYTEETAAFITVTNTDDDGAALTIDDLIVGEDANEATVAVRLDNAVEGGFRVRAYTREGTATAERVDYENVARILTFSGKAGETKTFTVPVINDAVAEGDETFTALLDFLKGTNLKVDISDTATVTITEDGAVLSIDNITVSEDGGTATVRVRLNKPVTGGFSVDAFTADGTAAAGEDYIAVAGLTLNFAGDADETESFAVSIVDDTVAEDAEVFTVHLRNLSGAAPPVATGGTATVTINDDDSEEHGMKSVCDRTPQVRDALLRELGATDCAGITEEDLGGIISLNLRFEGLTSLSAGDFSGLSSLLLLLLNDNSLSSLPEGIFSGLGSLRQLQLDDNGLSSLPEGVFSGLGALRGLHMEDNSLRGLPEGIFGGLGALHDLHLQNNNIRSLPEGVFNGLRSLETLDLGGNNLDALPEEIFGELGSLDDLDLSKNGFVSLPAGIFSGLTSLRNLNLRDNRLTSLPKAILDVPPLTDNLLVSRNPWDFALLVADARVAESEGRLDLTVRMTRPLDYDLTLQVSTADGTALAGEDYTPPDATLTIPAGQTRGTVSIPIISDGTPEESEVFELTVADGPLIFSGGDSDGLNPVSARATVTISEFASVTVSPARVTTSETGSAGTFSVALDTRPAADVLATVTSGDTTEGAVSSDGGLTSGETATLTFTPENWDIPQTITVTGLDDEVVDGDVEYTVSLATSSDDALYGNDDAALVTVVNTDDDSAALTVENVDVDEGAGAVTVTVRLGNAVAEGFRVRASTREDSALGGRVDYEDVARNLDFAGEAGETQTFSVNITNDAVPESAETFTVLLDNLRGTTIPVDVSGTGTVTITDDDTPGVSVSPVFLSLDEGGSGTYTVVLDTRPLGDVTVSIAGDNADVSAAPPTLVFTTSDWNKTQTVTVSAAHDNDTADERATLTHAVSGYGSVASADDVEIEVKDDDPDVTLSFGSAGYEVTEGGSVSVEVTLSEAPGRRVTVPVAVDGGTADNDDYVLPEPSVVTFAPTETSVTFTVSAESDYKREDTETLLLGFGDLAAAPGVTETEPAQTTVRIVNLARRLTPGQRGLVHGRTAGILSRSMAEVALGVIGSRLGAAPGRVTEVTVTGRSVLPSDLRKTDWQRFTSEKIRSAARNFENGGGLPDVDALMVEATRRSRFAFTLGDNDERPLTVWGAAGGLLVEGDPEKNGLKTDYDGDVFNALIGIDTALFGNWRIGAALAYGEGQLDYKAADGAVEVSGDVEKTMLSAYPYLSWRPDIGMSFWWIGGFGFGNYNISEVSEGEKILWKDVGAVDWMTAMGAERTFYPSSDWDFALRAKGLLSRVDLDRKVSDEGELLPGVSATNWRLRFEGEAGVIFQVGYQASVRPYALVSARWDGGESVGSDAVFADGGGGLQFQSGGALVVDLSFYAQFIDGDTVEHSAAGFGSVSFDRGRDGKGFAASVERNVYGERSVTPWKDYEFGDKLVRAARGVSVWETEIAYGWEELRTYIRSRLESERVHSAGFDFAGNSLNLGLEAGYAEETGEVRAGVRAQVRF